ncbi:MAG: hypothetical protein JXA36_05940, partial [Coriobacteriia bacterium]|nr:hypothetical protein [Coriobacteriia bacterium]
RPVPREEAERHLAFHIEQVYEIADMLLEGLRSGLTTEQSVAFISERRGLPQNAAAYWLAVTTVKGYLGELLARGQIEFFVREHAGWWKTVQ